jgi:hypothetical protein
VFGGAGAALHGADEGGRWGGEEERERRERAEQRERVSERRRGESYVDSQRFKT